MIMSDNNNQREISRVPFFLPVLFSFNIIFAQNISLNELIATTTTTFRDSIIEQYNPHNDCLLGNKLQGCEINCYLYVPDYYELIEYLDTNFYGIALQNRKLAIYKISVDDSVKYWKKVQSIKLSCEESIRVLRKSSIMLLSDTIEITVLKINLSNKRRNQNKIRKDWCFAFSDWCSCKWIICPNTNRWTMVSSKLGGI